MGVDFTCKQTAAVDAVDREHVGEELLLGDPTRELVRELNTDRDRRVCVTVGVQAILQ